MGQEIDYEALEPVDPDGPPTIPMDAYEVLEDGEHEYVEPPA
jgi:hypothetical protein